VRLGDELLQRVAITLLGVEEESRQPVHAKSVCLWNSPNRPVDHH
jgi:hypothetical protein